jgi:hypothetical protein
MLADLNELTCVCGNFVGRNIQEFETYVFGNSRGDKCYNVLNGVYMETMVIMGCCFIYV